MEMAEINREGGLAGGELALKAQAVVTGCWLTMKEVSLLMGTLARCTPPPGRLCCPHCTGLCAQLLGAFI